MDEEGNFHVAGSSQDVLLNKENQNEKKLVKKPKVSNEWRDEDIAKLIALVEERRPLWDKGSAKYKLPKDSLWQEIEQALGSKYPGVECKAKWANFRVIFNTNLAKYRCTKSGQGAAEKFKIHWRFFNSMLFLESAEVSQSTQSTSSLDILNPETDYTVLAELETSCDAPPLSPLSLSAPLTPLPEQPRKRSRPSQSPSPSPSSSQSYKLIAAQALAAISSQKPYNKYQPFGDCIAAKLQSLTEQQAASVERKIMQVLLE